jgi:putative NIF3 family GTP cyclohydrolase 1 type 2
MKGLDTDEIMAMALELAGFSEIPEDSGIHVRGNNIKKIIFTMDVNVGVLHMAKQLGFDAVVGHHPCGALFKQGEVYRRHIDLLEKHGIPRGKALHALAESIDSAVHRMENRRFRMLHFESPNNTVLEVDAAKLLGLPLMNVHNPLDETGRRILQAKIDEATSKNPGWKLKDVLQLIEELPEARYAREQYGISPRIFVGEPDFGASKVAFVHGAKTAPSGEIINFYWENGFKTVVILHAEVETLESLRKVNKGNLICTGHFLGDAIGITPFIHKLREKGLEVVCMGGIIDI